MHKNTAPVVLASASPRRAQLLEWAEISFETIVAGTDEWYPPELSPEAVAAYIAQQKSAAVQRRIGTARPIVAADTIVVLQKEIIGKPKDRDDAVQILSRLSGAVHRVITGVSIVHAKGENLFTDSTEVHFHPLTEAQIEFYVDNYKPYDKAGAYAIQEWIGVVGIKKVVGDFYNVMGLPVSRVVQVLKSLGF